MTNASRGLRPGLGPVFAYEWITLSRRWQWYASRCLFAGMLLASLIVVRGNATVPGAMTVRGLAALGQSFYIAVISTQITLVLLAAPAATAGSICLDRANGTLTHLLVTDLTDAEIVLGKLAARLVPVLGLVACALPLLAILTILGGVDPEAMFGGFLVTVGVAVLGCSLALFFSLWARTTHEALLATYAVWGIWLVGRPFLDLMNSGYGLSLSVPPRIADPYSLAYSPYWYPTTVGFADYLWFLAITSGLAAGLAGLAVLRLRAACTRADAPKKRRSFFARPGRLGAGLDLARYAPGPPLDFNPVLWREWHRSRPSRWGRIVGGLFAIVAVVASVGAILAPRASFAMAWVNGLQVSIGLLLLSVTAATSLAEERVRGSLDVLMATPLSTREIVVGKWLGAFRVVPAMAILPVLVSLANDPWKRDYSATAILIFLFVLVCGGAIVGLGLMLATWCSRLARAVALTVSCYLLAAVGWLFLCMMAWSGPDTDGMMMASPFMFAGGLTADLCMANNGRSHVGWGVFWLLVYAMAAAAFLGATLLSFNHCLGRVEVGIEGQVRARPRPKPEKVAEIAGEPA